MFSNFVWISIKIIILCHIKRMDSWFSVGDYTNESIYDLNGPECGLSIVPIVEHISFDNKCFHEKYETKRVKFLERHEDTYRSNQPSERIYRGQSVKDASLTPWVVHIMVITPQYSIPLLKLPELGRCTGVLITPRWVLTAAHCCEDVKEILGGAFVMDFGSNTKDGIHRVKVSRDDCILHPLYENPTIPGQENLAPAQKEAVRKRYDLAMIRISSIPRDTTHNRRYLINNICIPGRDEVNQKSFEAYSYGYGRINDKTSADKYPGYLQKATIKLKAFDECGLVGSLSGPSMLCSQNKIGVPIMCGGDSGGPLVDLMPIGPWEYQAILIGILQGGHGLKCEAENETAHWTPVSKHMVWIIKTMREKYSTLP